MLYHPTPCLRAAAFASRKPAAVTVGSIATQARAARPGQQSRCLSVKTAPPARPSMNSMAHPRATKCPKVNLRLSFRRSATTTAEAAALPPKAATQQPSLDWNTYLSLRQKRRHYNTFASIITSFATFATGASFLMSQDIDKLSGLMFGLDPVMAMGMVSVGFGAAGWLIGPFPGGLVFRLVYRRVIGQMQNKEKDFYRRIRKYRCDPAGQSMSNPVPDYYGEKISSVQGYRQWLKDQRAFRKKREGYPTA